jgi:CBS domain-containing protein
MARSSRWQARKVREVMSSPAETLHESTSLLDAARKLSDLHVSGVPVVRAGGAVVGVVSLYDIVGYLADHEGPMSDGNDEYAESDTEADDDGEQWARSIGKRDGDWLRNTPVAEVMTGDLIAVSAGAALSEVVALMEARRIHRVVVMDRDRPVGVVSTLDVLRAIAGAAALSA